MTQEIYNLIIAYIPTITTVLSVVIVFVKLINSFKSGNEKLKKEMLGSLKIQSNNIDSLESSINGLYQHDLNQNKEIELLMAEINDLAVKFKELEQISNSLQLLESKVENVMKEVDDAVEKSIKAGYAKVDLIKKDLKSLGENVDEECIRKNEASTEA